MKNWAIGATAAGCSFFGTPLRTFGQPERASPTTAFSAALTDEAARIALVSLSSCSAIYAFVDAVSCLVTADAGVALATPDMPTTSATASRSTKQQRTSSQSSPLASVAFGSDPAGVTLRANGNRSRTTTQ